MDADSNVTITVDTVSAMDVSGANSAISGEDTGNLFETLDKIVEGTEGVNSFVPDEDLSLADLMGLIGEGDDVSKVELEVAEVVVNTIDAEVTADEIDVKCESGNRADSTECQDGGEVTHDSVP